MIAQVTISVPPVVKAFGAGEGAVRALDDLPLDIREGEFFTPNKHPVTTVFQSCSRFPHLTDTRNIGSGLPTMGRPASAWNTRPLFGPN